MIHDIFFGLNKKDADKLYNVANVANGFYYWYWKLFNIIQSMFEYDGLPSTLPEREIEIQLLLTGHCVVFQDKKNNLITANTNIFGYDIYYNPTKATYANPLLFSKTLKIHDDCEIIYNNSLKDNVSYMPVDSSLNSFISRYSRQLADIESSINNYTVNTRMTSYPVGSSDSVIKSIELFFKKLRNGSTSIISDDAIINAFRNVDILGRQNKDGINDLLIARDKILEMFFREIGVKMYNPKKAQVNNEEVEANDQLLLISHDDMLKERKEGVERVNDMFGTSINVRLNEKFNTKNDGVQGGEYNDSL